MPRSKVVTEEAPKGPITSFEIVERPVSSRGQYEMDAETKALMDTVGTGKAVRLHIDERVDLHKIHMALRHAMKRADLSLHYKKVGERTLLAWAEKVKKAMLIVWFLFELGPQGIVGQPLGTFPDKDACVVASYQVSFLSGRETRCEPRMHF